MGVSKGAMTPEEKLFEAAAFMHCRHDVLTCTP